MIQLWKIVCILKSIHFFWSDGIWLFVIICDYSMYVWGIHCYLFFFTYQSIDWHPLPPCLDWSGSCESIWLTSSKKWHLFVFCTLLSDSMWLIYSIIFINSCFLWNVELIWYCYLTGAFLVSSDRININRLWFGPVILALGSSLCASGFLHGFIKMLWWLDLGVLFFF